MEINKYKEKNHKTIGIILFTLACVFFIVGVVLYQTYAIYEVSKDKDLVNGEVDDPGDLYFAFYQDDVLQKEMPEKDSGYMFNAKKSYCAVNGHKDESIIPWFDKDGWAVTVTGLTTSRTKCNLYFEKGEYLTEKISELPKEVVDSGKDGLYSIPHDDAEITYTEDIETQNMLKQEELRYAGKDPNNYVWFNNELWRMIGLVNTPEGQRIKIVKNESLGSYSWDSSSSEVNLGEGVNDWHQADLMVLLNNFYYNNLENQNCYIGSSNQSQNCSFNGKNGNKNGLKYVQGLIDEVTWTIGNFATDYDKEGTPKKWYNQERSKYENRNSTWQGKVAVLYPSDKEYTSSGTETVKQSACWETNMYVYEPCRESAYLMMISSSWTLAIKPNTENVGFVNNYGGGVANPVAIYPTLHLKTNTMVVSNNIGTKNDPFILN